MMIDVTVIAAAVKALAVTESAVIAGQDVKRVASRSYRVGSVTGLGSIAAVKAIVAAAESIAADDAEAALVSESGYDGMAADLIADVAAADVVIDTPPADTTPAVIESPVADVPAESTPGGLTDDDILESADAPVVSPIVSAVIDPDSADAYAIMQATFTARRCDLPVNDVLESACLADAALRTVTPALAAAIAADPTLDVTGIPCLVSIGTMMRPARIIALESRCDAALSAKNGESPDFAYPGLMMVRESTGGDVWHKLSRRTVMIAESLAAIYDADKPARPAKAAKATQAAPSVSKAAAGLAGLQAKAQKAALALQAAQAAADTAKAALDAAKATPAVIDTPAVSALILPAHLNQTQPAPAIIIARR